MTREKEYLYVGHYIDREGNFILKIGTTNDLKRRGAEHNRNYRKESSSAQMRENDSFKYDWYLKLSKYNTLRYEDKTRRAWKAENFGEYIRNDRFRCERKPRKVQVTIRKTYVIDLGEG